MIDAPLALYESTVPPDWIDYNGHMTESSYLLLVGNAADAFFRYIGIDDAYRAAGRSLYTAETHLHHLHEAALGDRLGVPLQLLDVGPKSLHLFHTVLNEATNEAVATELGRMTNSRPPATTDGDWAMIGAPCLWPLVWLLPFLGFFWGAMASHSYYAPGQSRVRAEDPRPAEAECAVVQG